LNFYPSDPRFRWIKRINPFFWVTGAKDRAQGGTEALYLPAVRFNFTRDGSLRLDYGRGHETFAGRQFDTGTMTVDAGVQITRWLELNAATHSGPAIFYDPDSPFQGYRRSTSVRFGLQPNAKVNSHTTYNFVTFSDQRTGLNVYRVHIIILRNTYQFSPWFFVRAVAQFDSSRERVLTDFLASYELTPGTVVHAGYGSLYGTESVETYHATARAFFFKASYRARF
jgi:hypothetical protein